MSSGKKIMIFMVVFNIVLLLMGFVATPFLNIISNLLGIAVDPTAESVLLPTDAYLLATFGLLLGLGAVVGTALAIATKDLSAVLRITSATIFTGLTINTMVVFIQSNIPFAVQMLVGVVIFIMWVISLTEFAGGYNW